MPSPATGPERPDIPDHPAYQQILTALADPGHSLAVVGLGEYGFLAFGLTG